MRASKLPPLHDVSMAPEAKQVLFAAGMSGLSIMPADASTCPTLADLEGFSGSLEYLCTISPRSSNREGGWSKKGRKDSGEVGKFDCTRRLSSDPVPASKSILEL